MSRKSIFVVLADVVAAAVAAFLFLPQVGGDADIVIGMSGGYKPYTFVDESGTLTGFEVELWDEIGRRTGRSVSYQTAAFSGLFGMLDSGKINSIANQITITPARLEKYVFSDPYVYYGAQLVVRGDDDSIQDLAGLRCEKVGVSLGSNYEQMVRDFDSEGEIEVITYEDYQGSLQDVALGRIDAVLNDRLAGLTTIEESGLDLKFGGDPVEWLSNAYPFVDNESNRELVNEVNQALRSMRADGTLEAISRNWFNADITAR